MSTEQYSILAWLAPAPLAMPEVRKCPSYSFAGFSALIEQGLILREHYWAYSLTAKGRQILGQGTIAA